jgi:hypothetical protein
MIQWALTVKRQNYEQTFTSAHNEVIQINETDYIDIQVDVPSSYFELGKPYLVIGDVPYAIELVRSTEEIKRFKTEETTDLHRKQIFYNYFGESEITLAFKDTTNTVDFIKVDIRARKANAELAQTMINFISEHMEDALMLCFSKSHTKGSFESDSEDSGNKLALLNEIVNFIVKKQSLFIQDHKYIWEQEMGLSDQGQPTGPDSVHFLLTHLDHLTPSNIEKANVLINNRAYVTKQVPQEQIVKNADVFENRVIYSFLFSGLQYLHTLKTNIISSMETPEDSALKVTDKSSEFVSFDHVLKLYKKEILLHHIKEINILQNQIKNIINLYDKYIKVKLISHLRPKFTPFVSSRPHYRKTFEMIHLWHAANAPDLSNNNFIMGLRSLTTIYEFFCLLALNKVINNVFDYQLIDTQYIRYDENTSYQGKITERPTNVINNLFVYSDGSTTLSIKYEPHIYQYREGISLPGDLINTSNKRRHTKYGSHYYCPDFVLNFINPSWSNPLVIVLDSKYQNLDNVLKYSLPETEQKYLRDIFEYKQAGTIGLSPIKLLLLMFAHGRDSTASRLHRRHRVGEQLVIYPQVIGVKTIPSEEPLKHLGKILKSTYIDHINSSNL